MIYSYLFLGRLIFLPIGNTYLEPLKLRHSLFSGHVVKIIVKPHSQNITLRKQYLRLIKSQRLKHRYYPIYSPAPARDPPQQ